MTFRITDHPRVFELPVRITRDGTWTYHTPMVPVVVGLLKPRTFVELGAHEGGSYAQFCQAVLDLKTGTRCTAIDSWEGDGHTSSYGPEILKNLREFHDPRYGEFSTLMQSLFDAARPSFADGSIDLLHIDGLHTYEAVKNDFETWLPKMSERGVMLFHDSTVLEGNFGVHRLWGEIAPRYPSFQVPYGFGLGMVAVGGEVPGAFLEFLRELNGRTGEILPLFEAIGTRNEFYRKAYFAGDSLHSCQMICNEWRAMTGQPVRNPTPRWPFAWEVSSLFGPMVVQDVAQMGRDAVSLARQAQQKGPRNS